MTKPRFIAVRIFEESFLEFFSALKGFFFDWFWLVEPGEKFV
jgi:hypothetical protein